MVVTVKSATNTVLVIRGSNSPRVSLRNENQIVRVIQSASPIPVTGSLTETIDGGNF